jgi:hypothetical protein
MPPDLLAWIVERRRKPVIAGELIRQPLTRHRAGARASYAPVLQERDAINPRAIVAATDIARTFSADFIELTAKYWVSWWVQQDSNLRPAD